jgi:UDP-N-acetylglucosamine 2-epimerase (non-hydrolysing)
MQRGTRCGGGKARALRLAAAPLYKWRKFWGASFGANGGGMKRFLCVVGTRPEAIKMAPVILELSAHAQVTTLCSGQHTKLAEEPLKWFGITPDDTIKVAKSRTLATLTAALLPALERMIAKHQPDVVVAQGDTTTVLAVALTAFYAGVSFAHVEAGLRTRNLHAPFPEEFNRVAADRLARWHFCPTRGAAANLRAEGIDPAHVYITGNTGIDALRLALERLPPPPPNRRLRRILLTAHRRENQGLRMEAICRAIVALVADFDDIEFAIPVHPNPEVRATFERLRVAHERVRLMLPLSYPRLVAEMARAHLIVTDSGGIQEEAPFLKKPVLVMRDVTERPEAVELGVARLVGAETASIVGAVRELLTDSSVYAKMAAGGSPYGDGYAAERIGAVFGFGQGAASAAAGGAR